MPQTDAKRQGGRGITPAAHSPGDHMGSDRLGKRDDPAHLAVGEKKKRVVRV